MPVRKSQSQASIRSRNLKALRVNLKKHGALSRDARSEIYMYVRSMVDKLSEKRIKRLIRKVDAAFPSSKSKSSHKKYSKSQYKRRATSKKKKSQSKTKFVKRVTDNKTTYGITSAGNIYKISDTKTTYVGSKAPKRIIERLKKTQSKKKQSKRKSSKKSSKPPSKPISKKKPSKSSKFSKPPSKKKPSKPIPKIAKELARIISPKQASAAHISKKAKKLAQKIKEAVQLPRPPPKVIEEIIDVEGEGPIIEPIIQPVEEELIEVEEPLEEEELTEEEYYDDEAPDDSDEETEIDEVDLNDRQVAEKIARIVTPRQASPQAVENKAKEIAQNIQSAKEDENVHVLQQVRRKAKTVRNPFAGIVSNDVLDSFE